MNTEPTKTADEIAAEAEAARVAALSPEERAAEEAAKAEAEARAEAMKAPVTVEALKLPDGVEVPEGGLDPLITIMNNPELTPTERAQELVNLHVKALADAQEAGSKAWEQTQEAWQNEVRADPIVGGANLEKSLTTVGKLLDQFGSKELREVFDLTGAGNNVHMVKFLTTVGEKLTEGGPVSGTPTSADENVARKLFPSMPR